VDPFETLKVAEGTIVAFEVMIGHNSRKDCGRESVKTSSDSQDSNAFCEGCCAYWWRLFWGEPGFLDKTRLSEVLFIDKKITFLADNNFEGLH